MKWFRPALFAAAALFTASAFADVADTKKAEGFARAAAKYAAEKGDEAAFAAINDKKGPFTEGEFYVIVYDFSGTCLAHGQIATRIGKNFLEQADPTGKKYVQEFVQKAKGAGEGWVDYVFKNPTTGKPQAKTTFIVRVPGKNYFVGCGAYK